MRALGLLLLCVVLLAVMQASYIVAEAKANEAPKAVDEAVAETKESRRERKLLRSQLRKGDEATADELDDTLPAEQDVMLGDQAAGDAGERSGRRERVSKEERRARKEGRQSARGQRKEERQARKEDRGNDRNQRKQDKAERKAARQAKKAERAGRNNGRVNCTSDSECGQDECCVPGRGGSTCRANRKPRALGKKCVTSCTCEGANECFQESEASTSAKNRRKPKSKAGRCVAPGTADLTQGKILTPESLAAAGTA